MIKSTFKQNYRLKNDDSHPSVVIKEINNWWSRGQSVSQFDRVFAKTLILNLLVSKISENLIQKLNLGLIHKLPDVVGINSKKQLCISMHGKLRRQCILN